MFSFGLPDFQAPKKAPTPLSFPMEDDAQKRHTDCIYFLASPLTCKKVMPPDRVFVKLAVALVLASGLLGDLVPKLTGKPSSKKVAVRNRGVGSMGLSFLIDLSFWVSVIFFTAKEFANQMQDLFNKGETGLPWCLSSHNFEWVAIPVFFSISARWIRDCGDRCGVKE